MQGCTAAAGAAVIDPLRFSREHRCLTGVVAPSRLSRLASLVVNNQGRVEYKLQGSTNQQGQPILRLDLAVDIAVPCQRCLEPLQLRFEAHRDLIFSAQLSEFEPVVEEDEEADTIADMSVFDVHDLVDQEVVLSLPMSTCHPEDQCRLESTLDPNVLESSPFSMLAKPNKRVTPDS